MTVDGTKVKLADLRKGLLVETGMNHTFVVDLVRAHIEWPEYIVDRLPDDFALTLTVAGEPDQTLTKSAGKPSDGGMVRFEFEWDDKTASVKLVASGNDQTIVLWSDHVAGDLDVDVAWDAHVEPLLDEPDEVEIDGGSTNAGEMSHDHRNGPFQRVLLDDDL